MEKAMTAVSLRQTCSAEVWKTRIASCRSSGQRVKAWCQDNAICVQTYYRWERKLLAEAGNQQRSAEHGRFVELPRTNAIDKTTKTTTQPDAVVAVLRAQGVECEIRSEISEEILTALVRAMNGHA